MLSRSLATTKTTQGSACPFIRPKRDVSRFVSTWRYEDLLITHLLYFLCMDMHLFMIAYLHYCFCVVHCPLFICRKCCHSHNNNYIINFYYPYAHTHTRTYSAWKCTNSRAQPNSFRSFSNIAMQHLVYYNLANLPLARCGCSLSAFEGCRTCVARVVLIAPARLTKAPPTYVHTYQECSEQLIAADLLSLA